MHYDTMCRGRKYQIKEGDTLYAISRRERIPLEWILRANPYVNVYNLQAGQWICIPDWREHNDEEEEENMRVPDVVVVDYVVGEGETLENVLNKFDADVEDLLKYNGMHAIVLKKGTILKIPKRVED